ncbi:hypothetical protein LguiA_018197 [Lonicera macranthoides]
MSVCIYKSMKIRHQEFLLKFGEMIDHLMHFRYSVFLVEGFDEKEGLLEKDDWLETKKQLMELVWEGNRIRRERRNATGEYYGRRNFLSRLKIINSKG